MTNLLFECFSEEMPARMQSGAREQLAALVTKALAAAGVQHGPVTTYASPRHLALRIVGLPEKQADITIEKKGPKVGAPQPAIDGFLKSTGLTLDQCEQREVGKDIVYFASTTQKGRPMADLLKDMLEAAMRDFTWPKSMRWGNYPITWVRPLHRLVCLLDSTIIPVQYGHITASNVTEGHRFLAPAPITLKHADDYVSALENAHVMVEQDKRRDAILTAAKTSAAAHNLSLVEDAGLLDEVTGLVEWPHIHIGTFDQGFMSLPREVLTSEMRHHQKYFALQQSNGELSNHFVITANMKTNDAGKAIESGNARVLRARLSDGEFYWTQDRDTKLDSWSEKLKDVVFHAKVGMMNEKVDRIVALATVIAKYVPGTDPALVKRAATLAKSDLVTGMVGEFPDLQGIMGRYYALEQGESSIVADAIRDHYKPVGASDDVPTEPTAICVALADKLDSITSLFAAGEKPTGSKDPLALRRAALGILRTLLENGIRLDLTHCLSRAYFATIAQFIENAQQQSLKELAPAKAMLGRNDAIEAAIRLLSEDVDFRKVMELIDKDRQAHIDTSADIQVFLGDRLKVIMSDEGIRHDVIASVLWLPLAFDPVLIRSKALALQSLLTSPDGAPILAAYKRASNILAAEEKKDKTSYNFAGLTPALLTEPEEKTLHTALLNAQTNIDKHLENEQFTEALAIMATLSAPLTAFFDKILVNAEDKAVRTNRLSLLALIRDTMHRIADFSLIEA